MLIQLEDLTRKENKRTISILRKYIKELESMFDMEVFLYEEDDGNDIVYKLEILYDRIVAFYFSNSLQDLLNQVKDNKEYIVNKCKHIKAILDRLDKDML